VSLNSKPQTAPYQVSTTLRRGVTVRGRLVGSDDRAPDSAVLLCRSYIPYGYDLNGSQGKEVLNGEFELPGCDPEKRLELFFVDPGHQLGARVELPPDQIGQAPVTVRMQPCGIAKARFLHEDGRPAVKMWPVVQLILAPGVPFGSEEAAPAADVIFMANVDREHHNPPNLITDEQGRTTFVTLIPGAKYWTIGDDFRGHFRREFSVGTGQTIDLGDIAVASRR